MSSHTFVQPFVFHTRLSNLVISFYFEQSKFWTKLCIRQNMSYCFYSFLVSKTLLFSFPKLRSAFCNTYPWLHSRLVLMFVGGFQQDTSWSLMNLLLAENQKMSQGVITVKGEIFSHKLFQNWNNKTSQLITCDKEVTLDSFSLCQTFKLSNSLYN